MIIKSLNLLLSEFLLQHIHQDQVIMWSLALSSSNWLQRVHCTFQLNTEWEVGTRQHSKLMKVIYGLVRDLSFDRTSNARKFCQMVVYYSKCILLHFPQGKTKQNKKKLHRQRRWKEMRTRNRGSHKKKKTQFLNWIKANGTGLTKDYFKDRDIFVFDHIIMPLKL